MNHFLCLLSLCLLAACSGGGAPTGSESCVVYSGCCGPVCGTESEQVEWESGGSDICATVDCAPDTGGEQGDCVDVALGEAVTCDWQQLGE